MLPKPQTKIVNSMDYVICLPRHKSRRKTVEKYFGENILYRYYKTKGYYRAQTLAAEHDLGAEDVVCICVEGHVINEQLNKSLPHVIYIQDDWQLYTDEMFGCPAVKEAYENYNKQWDDECLMDAWSHGLNKFDKRLPNHIANDLKSMRDRAIYLACYDWFLQQKMAKVA